MAKTHCPQCGASYALVGHVHNCRPVSRGSDKAPDQHPSRPGISAPVTVRAVVAEPERKDAGPREFKSYKYRDPEKRKAYMRDLMRKRYVKKDKRNASHVQG